MVGGRTTTVERVISVVYRDYGVARDIPKYDAVEWIGSGLLELGVPMVLEDKVETLDVEDYRAELPCSIVELVAVRKGEDKVPMQYAGGTFHMVGGDTPSPMDSSYRYTANNNYLFASFETGTVDVSYRAFPLDDRGYPLVPDEEKVIRALAAFVAYRLDYIEWRAGRLTDKVYADSQQKWLFAKASASTGMKIYNYDQMESIRASWVRLIPSINDHSTHFTYSSVQEQRHNLSQ